MTNEAVFAETFWTPYEEKEANQRIGQRFIVIGEKPKDEYDFEEVGKMYVIEFEDGVRLDAFPEEVEKEWQVKNGRNQYPNGYYAKN